MPVSKQKKSGAISGFTFINIAHPDETRQRSTQRAIRSGAMASIGRARRKRPQKPVVVELDMLQTAEADANAEDVVGTGVATTIRLYKALSFHQKISPALPHLGIFAVEPDNRARELLHFST